MEIIILWYLNHHRIIWILELDHDFSCIIDIPSTHRGVNYGKIDKIRYYGLIEDKEC